MARKTKGMKPSINEFEEFTDDLGWVDPKFLFEVIKHVGVYVYDIETTGINPRKDRLDGIAFYVPAGTPKDFGPLGYYDGSPIRAWFPFNDYSFMCHIKVGDIPSLEPKLAPIGVDMAEIYRTAEGKKSDELILVNLRPPMDQEPTMEALRPIWTDLRDVIGITHHGKFDSGFLWVCPGTVHPIRINNTWADSMLADFCSDERRKRYGLKVRVKQEFNHQMTPYAEAVRGQSLLAFCNAKPLGVYAMDDCYWEYRLHERAVEKLIEQEPPPANRTEPTWSIEKQFGRVMGRLERVYWGIDTRISEILMEMQNAGVLIDWQWLQEVDGRIVKEKDEIWNRMESFLGWPLNPNSGKQVADALFAPPPDGLGLPQKGIPIGKTGDPSTSDKVIKHFARFHPLVADILKWRSLDTIQSGFVTKLIKLALDSPDGRVYAHFNQTRTVIARLSCISSESFLSIRLEDEDFRRSIKIAELKRFAGQTVRIVTHKGREQRILNLINKGPGVMYEVTTDDGNSIRCTQEHRFLTERGWRALKDIEPGCRLLRAEVCEAPTSRRRQTMDAGSTIVHQDLCGRSPRNALEDSSLRTVERNRPDVQSGLRLGVSALVPGGTGATTGPGRDLSGRSNLGQTTRVEGVRDLARVVQGDLRRQRSDAGRSEGQVRDLAPSTGVRCEGVSRVRAGHAQEAWETSQRLEEGPRGVLRQEHVDRPARGGAISSGDGDPTLCRGLHCGDGPASSWNLQNLGASTVLVGSPDRRRARSVGRTESGNGGATGRLSGGVRGLGGDLPALDRPERPGEADRLNSTEYGPRKRGQEGAPHLCGEPSGDASLTGFDGRRDPASTFVLLLEELASGLRVAGPQADGRGRWRVSPEVRGDEGSRQAQDQESEGAWIPSASRQQGGRDKAIADSGEEDRGRTWARVTSIVPVGVEDVWDIEVEGDHSYVAHGFVNHNSSDPINFQNQPRDRNLVRKAYCAHRTGIERDDQDMYLFGADYGQIELRIAAHLAQEDNMIEVYQMGGICTAENGEACDRYKVWACENSKCEHTWTPEAWWCEGNKCPQCGGEKTEHQRRCRHVDLHQRTAEDARVKRNPLAKCLDGSTMVLTNEGPFSLDMLIDPEQEPGEHQPVVGVTLDDASGGWVEAESSIVRHNRPTKIIVTKRSVVIATNDHRFQVYGDGLGDLDPDTPGYVHEPGKSLVAAEKLEKGMKLPLADFGHRRDPEWHKHSWPVTVQVNPFTKEVGSGPTYMPLNEDWAYFAGMFIGDGCATSGHQFVITHGDSDDYECWRQSVRESCWKIGLPAVTSGNKKETRLGSRVVYQILSQLGLAVNRRDGHGKTFRVPNWVIRGGPKIIWAFLAGLWDTDGSTFRKDGVGRLCTKSPELAGQVAFLLRYLGVPISVSPSYNKSYERYYYNVNVLANGLKEFAKYLPLRHHAKIDALQERITKIKCPRNAGDDEVLLVIDGGERTVFDFHVKSESHLYMQQGLRAHNNLNFGLLYRMGAPKFCVYADLFDADGFPMVDFAKEVITRWHAAYPGIALFHEATEYNLMNNGWIAKTIFGRRRRLDQEARINRFRAVTQGIQFQVSGSAQDVMKTGMIRIFEERNRRRDNARPAERKLWDKVRILLQIHDELVLEGPIQLKDEITQVFKEGMEGVGRGALRVPLAVDVKYGRTWDDIH